MTPKVNFTITGDIGGFIIRLYREENQIEVDGLLTRFGTLFELAAGMPPILDWAKGNVSRHFQIDMLDEEGQTVTLHYVKHSSSEQQLCHNKWIVPSVPL